MAARLGQSQTVGRITTESAVSEQLLHRFKAHSEPVLSSKAQVRLGETLRNRCIQVIVENFSEVDITGKAASHLSKELVATITSRLPSSISPLIIAKRVTNENYWKRLCLEKYGWELCHLGDHGARWKQLYFEKLLQETLEDCDGSSSVADLYHLVDAVREEIFTVKFEELPSHLPLHNLLAMAHNLVRLELCYGRKNVGMKYDRMHFGMKIDDATSLTKVFEQSRTLTTLVLSRNIIDDDLLRLLVVGLQKNRSITHLDLSHNKITDFGVQLLTRLLQPGSALTALNLSNNLVRNEGGKHLARELQTNDSLQKLSLRLNCLGDDGCRALLDAVGDNDTLLELSIGCNGAASASSIALAALLRRTRCELRRLDATNNEFGHDDIKSFATSMYYNKSLVQLDLRQNRGYSAATEEIRVLEEALLRNEHAQSAAERSDI